MSIESSMVPGQEQPDNSADQVVQLAHAPQGRDSVMTVVLGIAAGMAVIFLVLVLFPPPLLPN